VAPLRGIARAFRLESFYGVEGADNSGTFNTGNQGAPVFNDATQSRRGETALATALSIIDSNSPVDQQLRGEVLTDLGDWYLIANALRRAYDTYAEAGSPSRRSTTPGTSSARASSPTGPRSARSTARSSSRPRPWSRRGAALQRGSRRPHRQRDFAHHRRARRHREGLG
jgi:hypothetical protein